MFSAMFEVNPKSGQFETYLAMAKMLRPELDQIEGFVDNTLYASLTREDWLLSLSAWHDEKALVRWRIQGNHHKVQQAARDHIFSNYHLRIGQITADTHVPDGQVLLEQRLDVTETGIGTAATLLDGKRAAEWIRLAGADAVAKSLGLNLNASGLIDWDVFDALTAPGEVIAVATWSDLAAAEAFEHNTYLPEGVRLRHIRVVRDYGMFDRREAPQYFAKAERQTSRA